MPKVAVITDTHIGAKNDSESFQESQIKFFKNTFKRTLEENSIEHILHLGDMFDHRTKMGVKTQNVVIDLFESEFKDYQWHIIVGNHDSFYKNTIEVNSLKFLKMFSNVEVIDETTLKEFYGREILMVPWQTDPELFSRKVTDMNTSCKVCMGHFAINGFYLNLNKVCTDEIDIGIFVDNFDLTFSGHFHSRDLKEINGKKVQYIGNPFHMNRGDANSDRGFVILDTDTLEYNFVNNEDSTKYFRIKYPEDFSKFHLKNNIIEVEYKYNSNSSEEELQKYLDSISLTEPLNPPIVKRIYIEENAPEDFSIEDDSKATKNNLSILIDFVESSVDLSIKDDITEIVTKYFEECLKGDANE